MLLPGNNLLSRRYFEFSKPASEENPCESGKLFGVHVAIGTSQDIAVLLRT